MHWQESWRRISLKVQRKNMYNPSRIRNKTGETESASVQPETDFRLGLKDWVYK